MKTIKSIYKYKVIFILFFFTHLFVIKTIAGTIVVKIEKEKEVLPSSVIFINYSAKNIEIHTWNQNKVKQVIELTIEPIDTTKLKELINELKSVDIKSNSKGNIELPYNLNIEKRGVINDKKIKTRKGEYTIALKNGKIFTVKKFEISIVFYVPQNNELDLKSAFSNISLGNLSNKAKLNLSSVTLKANNINDLELEASFSKIWLSNVNNAVFNTSSCESNSINITKAEILSAFSKFNFTKVGNLNIQKSSSDIFTLSEIEVITSKNTVFTSFLIGELKDLMDISSKNGDITIDKVNQSFSQINISNVFSTITIGTLSCNAFILNTNTKFTEFKLPDDLKLLKYNETVKSFYKGSKSSNQKITINCTSCNVNF